MVHKTAVDNTEEAISPRMEGILRHVWNLNEQELSYLNRHFMLVREPRVFAHYHNLSISNILDTWQVKNGGVVYDIVWQKGLPEEVMDAPHIAVSFRYQEHSHIAICIIQPRYNQRERS